MRILITAGPTREPIDAVRYIGNRSSGRMGMAIAEAAILAGHEVTLILGPISVMTPAEAKRITIETAAQMHQAVLNQFPSQDLLIMAAAVADYRPKTVRADKMPRGGLLTIECEPTPDILVDVAGIKQSHQRVVGFSLEGQGNLDRAREKLIRKNLDLIVYNPLETMDSGAIQPTLLWRDGRSETLASMPKTAFSSLLLQEAIRLFR